MKGLKDVKVMESVDSFEFNFHDWSIYENG